MRKTSGAKAKNEPTFGTDQLDPHEALLAEADMLAYAVKRFNADPTRLLDAAKLAVEQLRKIAKRVKAAK